MLDQRGVATVGPVRLGHLGTPISRTFGTSIVTSIAGEKNQWVCAFGDITVNLYSFCRLREAKKREKAMGSIECIFSVGVVGGLNPIP